jgi:hypothetical protein
MEMAPRRSMEAVLRQELSLTQDVHRPSMEIRKSLSLDVRPARWRQRERGF